MGTNSADPDQLLGFAHALSGPSAATATALEQLDRALTRYRASCAAVPFDSPAHRNATNALDLLGALTFGTRRVAGAFATADSQGGADGVRRLDDLHLARALGGVSVRSWGTSTDTDVGVVVDGDRSWSLGPDGLTAGLVGSILLGARATARTDFDTGPLRTHHELEAMLGASAHAEARTTVGRDGVGARGAGGAFIGAQVQERSDVTVGPCTVSGSLTGAAGAGASGSAEAGISRDGLGIGASFLAAAGLGAGAEASLSCDAPDVRSITRWGSDRLEDASDIAEDIVDWTEDRIDGVRGRLRRWFR